MSKTYKQIIAHTISPDFRNSVKIVQTAFPDALHQNEVLLKNIFVGINASDVNFVNGKYKPDVQAPFAVGFEAVGEVVEVHKGIDPSVLKAGDHVVSQCYGSFAEYQVVPHRTIKKIPTCDKHYLPLDLSGTTASISIARVLQPAKGDRALVTAAAGGTGSMAVQLLRHQYGCKVIGVCSSEEKEQFLLNEVGCEGVVNYKKETMRGVPKAVWREFGRICGDEKKKMGPQVVYESVGGELLDRTIDSLALHGKVLSIGSISSYTGGWKEDGTGSPLPLQLLSKSASLHTFLLPHFTKHINTHFRELCALYEKGVIKSFVDEGQPFKGLGSVPDAVDYMYAGKNKGKVIVAL
ncbi:NADPH2:quinone reductase [Angomonas deanei]|uniref:Alcohol dehydrogenase GroES-like domain/Zinc-binding dehydrogenase, putative n=1 Tax=Angomonas deanei TaxID=59799 RepID=A0A7G2CJI3_9TRYP|nr:NADPH2:quinone reductase [Angomonas deanei]CAD2219559.1 Alcohol dehydrogenase GroES-like domain/Zinc-binding dehydrogenase, putative [Angomonas deanei]|eukprot:EPY18749.1 NADPH2:quinone reductase [Angomonas deanei]